MEPFIHRKPGFAVAYFPELIEAQVISRPNRFLIKATINRAETDVHIHDPGRLGELIFPGNTLLIRRAEGPKTHYSVTFCKNENIWTFNDARYHSSIASMFIKPGYEKEVKTGNSRIDFKLGDSYIEVKSGTLVDDGIAKFPDAVTARGKKHLETLMELIDQGYNSYVLFLIFNENAECFLPNYDRDPEFARTYYSAISHGVNFKFLVFSYKNGEIVFKKEIKPCV
ncbi:DNA/RNA nuclease SfsA [Ferroplasma sp.]|uniref:DNA/RNA nuclease SfsA n=1 Tax=Ferroplasma sp. TaxID=2591003 RepID=UPI00307D189D